MQAKIQDYVLVIKVDFNALEDESAKEYAKMWLMDRLGITAEGNQDWIELQKVENGQTEKLPL